MPTKVSGRTKAEKIMKKTAILLIVTIIFSLFSLASCKKNEYEPVESTELEATEVMSFTLDGESYSVRYELYRALFLNYKTDLKYRSP
jgi:hypothetical protein